MKNRYFLIGYMGAGKTTLGTTLAKKLNLEFVDTDVLIESRYKKSIGDIFKEKGEQKFREIEQSVLHEVAAFENVVISTGGGSPCFFDNMRFMSSNGVTVYLKSSPEMLAKRLNSCKDKRPLLKDKSEKELLEFISATLSKREQHYLQAKIIFDTKEFENKEESESIVDELIGILLQNEC